MKSTTKVLILALCFGAMSRVARGQQDGDFRTHQSGGWHDAATWERYNGLFWEWPSQAPSSADNVIRILAAHSVTVGAADATADQLTVDGILNVNFGRILTIADGPGIDLVTNLPNASILIDGSLTNNGTTQISGTIQINQGGAASGNDFVYTGPFSRLVFNGSNSIDSGTVFGSSTNGPATVTVQRDASITLNAAVTISGFLEVEVLGTLQVADTLTTNWTTEVRGTLQVAGTLISNGTTRVLGFGTLQVAGTLTNNGTTTIYATFQIDEGGFVNGSLIYFGGTLVFNNSSGPYNVNSRDFIWPSTSIGPVIVNVRGPGGITMNVARSWYASNGGGCNEREQSDSLPRS
jgi:hypothetical protein